MDVRVKERILAPGVQHAEKADLRSEMFRIGGDLQQGGVTRAEQQSIQDLLVVQGERSQFTRQRKDHVHVGNRQQFPAARRQPLIAGIGLTRNDSVLSGSSLAIGTLQIHARRFRRQVYSRFGYNAPALICIRNWRFKSCWQRP